MWKQVNIFGTAAALTALMVFSAGCGREHPAPPVERSELILRFFKSMESGDAVSATEQGMKLHAMDSGNDYVLKLVAIQQSNSYLKQAQEALNNGDADGALKVLDEGIRAYPMNGTLKLARREVRGLRNVPALLAHLRQARGGSAAAMQAALNAAETGLPAQLTPAIQEYLRVYREEAAAKAAAERKLPAEPAGPALPEPPVAENAGGGASAGTSVQSTTAGGGGAAASGAGH